MKVLLSFFLLISLFSCGKTTENFLYDKDDEEYNYYAQKEKEECIKDLTKNFEDYQKNVKFDDFEKNDAFKVQKKKGDTVQDKEILQIVRVKDEEIYFRMTSEENFKCPDSGGCIVVYKKSVANSLYTNLINGKCDGHFKIDVDADSLKIDRESEVKVTESETTYVISHKAKTSLPEFSLLYYTDYKKTIDYEKEGKKNSVTEYDVTFVVDKDEDDVDDDEDYDDYTACEVVAIDADLLDDDNSNEDILKLNCALTQVASDAIKAAAQED